MRQLALTVFKIVVMKISLVDNNQRTAVTTFDRADVAPLFPIANCTIAELCRRNDTLLVLPDSFNSHWDTIKRQRILTIDNTNHPDRVHLQTGNLMGFFGVGDLQVKIGSRFDQGRGDYFLHYMLQRVMAFNTFDLCHQHEEEEVFDFLLLLFPYYLKMALRQGLYREYRNATHDDDHLRGTIDIGRQLQRHTPFDGRIAYRTRTMSHDNNLTQLIRHTIEHLRQRQGGDELLNLDRATREAVARITEHTPSYSRGERDATIARNLRATAHPYFINYQPLQRLCLQILRYERLKYGAPHQPIYGILFDGAWLWEEYLNTLLRDYGFQHPQNQKGFSPIYLFNDGTGRRFPDFYNADLVLDAKYKRLGSLSKVSAVGRDDLHQLMAYMQTLPRQRGGFIAPLSHRPAQLVSSVLQDGTSTISIFGIEIDGTATSFAAFARKMQENERYFLQTLSLTPST